MDKLLSAIKENTRHFLSWLQDKTSRFMRWTDTIGSGKNTKIFLATVSLLISVVLWLFVAWDGDTEGTRALEVPLQYVNLSRGYTIYSSTNMVEVRMLGKVNTLSRITPSEVKAEVDLQGLQSGTYKLPIRIEAPQNARIRSWTPSTSEIDIYRQIERTIPITWVIDGKLPEGKIISSVEITPAEVSLTGPEVDVLAVQNVQISIPAAKLADDLSLKLPVSVADKSADASKLTLSPATVNANIVLENEIIGEQIPVQISVVGAPADGLEVDRITVMPDKVMIRGRGDAVRNMTALVLSPIDVTGLDQNLQLMLPLQPEEQKDVEILGPERARVDISLRKKMAAKTFSSVPVSIVGAASGAEWSVSPSHVTLTVNGTQMVIDGLTSGQTPCELYVDVTNIVTHQLTLPVLMRNMRNDFQIVQIDPPQVTATLVD